MKNIALIYLLLFTSSVFCQEDKIFTSKSVDRLPVLITCKGDYLLAKECTNQGIQSHLYQKSNPNMIFKMRAKKKQEERVLIQYVVTNKGLVENVKIKSRNKKIKKKFYERMKSLSNFKPAIKNGIPVSVKMELELTISI